MSEEVSTVRVNLGERSYDIRIGSGVFAGAVDFVNERAKAPHMVVITDSNVDGLYGDAMADRFVESGVETQVLVVDAGELSKSTDVASGLWQTMLDEGCDRQSVVMAVGGGVIGDLAGFIAATFARGLTFFQAPTTLLAQVDSSVGGKVGINLEGAKNMVGAFWQPHGVLIDTDVLATLPEREYRAGLAEVIKYGVILDEEFFAMLESEAEAINAREARVLRQIVERSCQLKAQVVEEDERETSGRRAILNYGHTFAHALEAATGYSRLLHGEAVAIGMASASRLAESLGRIPSEATDRQVKLMEALGLPVETPADLAPDDLVQLMYRDKKVADGELRFVLPTRIGEVELVAGPEDESLIESAIRP